MNVPDAIRKCVVFIGFRASNGDHKLLGSGFFVGSEAERTAYLVTARHVVARIRERGLDDVAIRLNLKDGSSTWHSVPLTLWFLNPDPTIDIAVLEFGPQHGHDHLVIEFEMCATEARINEQEVGLGDEVFIVGLFRHHHGIRRNIPIVRVGSLASMGEEHVSTQLGAMDALLIEARSIGGLSGSPVFLNLGIHRVINGKIQAAAAGPVLLLLGSVYGHFDDIPSQQDAAPDDGLSVSQVNVGIAIVVPFRRIAETIAASKSD